MSRLLRRAWWPLLAGACSVACADVIGADFGDYRAGAGGTGARNALDGGASSGGYGGALSSAGGPGGGRPPSGGTSGTSGGRTSGGGPGAGGALPGGNGGAAGSPGSGGATHLDAGKLGPLDIYFVVDRSGSMTQAVTGGTKWSVISGALDAFLNDPARADIGTGLGYFPYTDPKAPASCATTADCTTAAGNFGACTGLSFLGTCLGCYCSLADACQTTSYLPAVPLSLPPNPQAIIADIATRTPGGGTPTRPALEGSMTYALQWAAAHPGRTTVIVLATDGDPTGCTTNTVQDAANIAANGLVSGIRTFVLGVGSSLTSLNSIAAAGGTTQAYVLDTAGNLATQFAAAMDAIVVAAASP